MRARHKIFMLIIVCFVFTFILTYHADSIASGTEENQVNYFQVGKAGRDIVSCTITTLPDSLQLIEDEAFEGTGIQLMKIPRNVERVGEKSFAHMHELISIWIPNKVASIATDAFIGSGKVTLRATIGSYADKWAKDAGIPFQPVESIYALNITIIWNIIFQIGYNDYKYRITGCGDFEIKHNNPGRMQGEIVASRYESCTLLHIQGLSPPYRIS